MNHGDSNRGFEPGDRIVFIRNDRAKVLCITKEMSDLHEKRIRCSGYTALSGIFEQIESMMRDSVAPCPAPPIISTETDESAGGVYEYFLSGDAERFAAEEPCIPGDSLDYPWAMTAWPASAPGTPAYLHGEHEIFVAQTSVAGPVQVESIMPPPPTSSDDTLPRETSLEFAPCEQVHQRPPLPLCTEPPYDLLSGETKSVPSSPLLQKRPLDRWTSAASQSHPTNSAQLEPEKKAALCDARATIVVTMDDGVPSVKPPGRGNYSTVNRGDRGQSNPSPRKKQGAANQATRKAVLARILADSESSSSDEDEHVAEIDNGVV